MKRSFLLLFFPLFHLMAHAQVKEKWSAATGPVQWLRTTGAGALCASTAKGLQGIDPATGTIAWTIDALANVPESGYSEVANTPFISIAPDPAELYIIEPFTGAVVFNSRNAGINNIASKFVLPESNAIVVTGQKADGTAAMACVDMGTGKVRWTKDDQFSRLTGCSSAGKDAILLSTLFFAYKLDANTGAEIWKKSPDPNFEKMSGLTSLLDKGGANLKGMDGVHGLFITTEHAPELCFMGMQTMQRKESTDAQGKTTVSTTYRTFINAFNIADGAYAWSQPLTMQQQLGTMVPLPNGLLVGAADRNSADLLTYASGEGLWGKKGNGISLKGPLNGAVPLDDGTILISGGKDGAVTLVDKTGLERWKKAMKVGGTIRSITILDNAIMVSSDEETEIIDKATGVSKLDKAVKGGSDLVITSGSETYLFNTKDGLLYAMPSGGGALKALGTSPIGFEGKEDPTRLEKIPEGLVLTSEQNIAMIGTDGNVKYKKHFPAGRESGLTRALKYASAVRAAYYTALFGYTSAAFGAVSQNIQVQDTESAVDKQMTGDLSGIFGDAARQGTAATGRFLQEANLRLKATATTNDVHFMMTDGGKREYQLVALKKSDGSVIGTIPLGRDKAPVYEVDAITNTVYLVSGEQVKCFSL
jgi:outer membrane protein assembly factor BamB